mgnify:CR=1 FL=1
MTNAEKLSKDTNKLASILLGYCLMGGCEGCVFEQDCSDMNCGCIGFTWKKWLEQEVEEDAKIH